MSDLDYNDFENDIGLGDEDRDKIRTNRVDWYKGEKGRTDRVALIYFNRSDVRAVQTAKRLNANITSDQINELVTKSKAALAEKLGKPVSALTDADMLDLSEVRLRTWEVSYQEGQGFGYILNRLGKEGPEADKVWAKLPQPKTTVTTLLLVYPTDKEGDIDKDKLRVAASGAGYGTHWLIRPWKFSGDDKYNRIRKLNKGLVENGLSIGGQDLKLECKETKYQQIDINLAGPALWQKSEKFKDAVLKKALEFYDKLSPAREVSTDELRSKLGLGGPIGGGDASSDDYDQYLNQV